MHTRTISIISACVITLAAIAGGAYALTRTSNAPTPHFWAKAKATPATVACLAANSKLTVPKGARTAIEQNALIYLSDVPAGTNVDVQLASYTGTSVTGSDRYPSKYGSYNFAMTKEGDGWHFTDFKHCR